MAMNMNQIDFDEIRARQDRVRGSKQAHEKKLQRQKDQTDLQKTAQNNAGAMQRQDKYNASQEAQRQVMEAGADKRAAGTQKGQMDRLALAAALELVGAGGKLPEGFDANKVTDLIKLAGSAGAATRGEARARDALDRVPKLIDTATGLPLDNRVIQDVVGAQTGILRQGAGESDPIGDFIRGARGDMMAPGHDASGQPVKSAPAADRRTTGQREVARQTAARPTPSPRQPIPDIVDGKWVGNGADPRQAPAVQAPTATARTPTGLPALNNATGASTPAAANPITNQLGAMLQNWATTQAAPGLNATPGIQTAQPTPGLTPQLRDNAFNM